MTEHQRYYLAIDVETSGRNMNAHFLVAFGAVLLRTSDRSAVETFSTYVRQPPHTCWEERCVTEFWTRDARMQALYEKACKECSDEKTPGGAEALTNFVAWARGCVSKYGRENIVVITDTAGYDVGWLDRNMPAEFSMNYLLGDYTLIRDVSSFHMGVARVTPHLGLWRAEERARAKLGLQKCALPVEHDHDPVNDAFVIALEAAQIARAIEERVELKRLQQERK
jgi:hypothetical protein